MTRPQQRHRAPNQVRIIGGRWRHRLISFPNVPSLRPTPDRVRETLFNWLGQDLTDLSTLDLFAGSGALSLEALSRGARAAVAVDRSDQAIASLRSNVRILGADALELHQADALQFLRNETRRFDIVFIDPPFDEEWLPRVWPLVAPRLNRGGFVYLEQPAAIVAAEGWEIYRHRRAGGVHYHLLRFAVPEPAPSDHQGKLTP